MKRKLIALALCLALCLAFTACSADDLQSLAGMLSNSGAASAATSTAQVLPVHSAPPTAPSLPQSSTTAPEDDTSAPQQPEPEAEPADVGLNMELMALFGKSNAELKALLGNECYASIVYGGAASVSYTEQDVLYPLVFWLDGDEDIMRDALQDAKGPNGEFPTHNPFPNDFTVWLIYAWDDMIPNYIFPGRSELGYEALCEAFGQRPDLELRPANEGMDAYEFDTWLTTFTYKDYVMDMTFIDGGEVPYSMMINEENPAPPA